MEMLTVTPAYIDFGPVKIVPGKPGRNQGNSGKKSACAGGTGSTREFTLANRGATPINIGGITANPGDMLSVFPVKPITLRPGGTERLQICLTPANQAWMMNGALLIKSDLPDLPEKIVWVSAEFVKGK